MNTNKCVAFLRIKKLIFPKIFVVSAAALFALSNIAQAADKSNDLNKNYNAGKVLTKKDIAVTGKVTDQNGNAIPGVSIKVKGSTKGTTTNNDGIYSLTVPDNAVLIISSIGYELREENVAGRSVINVILKIQAKAIEEVVVVGYGTQRKIDVTGAVAAIRGEEISKQASINAVSALQGKVAGVQIINSGAPGASPEIKIRGVGTVYGSASPLYVVDGVWYNDISFLNTNDIENLTVLKDASSQAIYGIRAANGVVVISTKKGKKNGKANVSYNGYAGWQTVTNEVKMANASEFATIINELYAYSGSPALFTNPGSFGTGTNWNHQILRSALVTNHSISLNGGTDKSSYNLSLGYLNQDGIVQGNNYTRYTALLQNEFQPFDRFKFGYTVNGSASNSKDIPGGIFHQIYSASPVVPVYYKDGTYGDPSDFNLGDGANFNPQASLDFFDQKSKNYRVNGNIFGEVKLPHHLTFRTSVGGEFGQAEVKGYTPVYVATLKQRSTQSYLSLSRDETRNWIVENTLKFENKYGNHAITVLAGQSAQSYTNYGFNAGAPNVPNTSEGDRYVKLGTAAGVTYIDRGDKATTQSFFGRVGYSYQNRYSLNATLRGDGSSKFSGDKRWGYFPAIGVGWTVTNESFMKNQHILNNLKLRGSWGQVGNASVPSNITTLVVSNYPPGIFGPGTGNPSTAASVSSIVAPTLNWEKTETTDIGLEAAVLKNRLTFEADYYNRLTKDAIFNAPIPGSLGTSGGSIIANQATIRNRGVEFTANWKDIIHQTITYSIGANIAYNENKVITTISGKNPIYAGGAAATGGSLATRTIVGSAIGGFYGYQVAGVFQTNAEAASSGQAGAKAGDLKFVDQNKDGKIDLTNDRVVIGNPNPKYSYGINTNVGYKNFDLTVDFQGVSKVSVYNANIGLRFGNENYSKDFFDHRWHGAGTSNSYASALIGGGQNYVPNSFFVEDGSYFRIRNIQLGYTLPIAWLEKAKINKVRIYANAQNAFNFFKYKGFTPEVGGSITNQGIDTNVYPLSATYNFGVNVTF